MELIILRIVHVVGGMFWVGSALFNSFFLFPAMAAAGPAAGAIMGGMQRRRLFIVLPSVALLTILAGLRLMWITSAGFAPAYFSTGSGATYSASGGAAIVAFVLGMTVGRPTGMRIGKLQQTLSQTEDDQARAALTAELAKLQRRNLAIGHVMNLLLIIAAVGMAVGRYMN